MTIILTVRTQLDGWYLLFSLSSYFILLEHIYMNLLKGLESGLFCMHVCGNSETRNKHAKVMEKHTDKGILVREVRNAPRDARYKIDWYFRKGVNTSIDTVDWDSVDFHVETLAYLGLDESFCPAIDIKRTGSYECKNGFELCYGKVLQPDLLNNKKDKKYEGYYYKYHGVECTLRFDSQGNFERSKFFQKYDDYTNLEHEFSSLLHQIRYFARSNNLI